MKSRISIEIDFDNNNQPVIQILQTSNSDDVRDKLLSNFCQQFGGSSWCMIKWVDRGIPLMYNQDAGFNRIHISPINREDFAEQAAIMLEQDRLNKAFSKGVGIDNEVVDDVWDDVINIVTGGHGDEETIDNLKQNYNIYRK